MAIKNAQGPYNGQLSGGHTALVSAENTEDQYGESGIAMLNLDASVEENGGEMGDMEDEDDFFNQDDRDMTDYNYQN